MKLQLLAQIAVLSITFQVFPLHAEGVFVRKVSEKPKSLNDEAQESIRIGINDQLYQIASLGDWGLWANLHDFHFAASPPSPHDGLVGIRVDPYVDKDGKPLSEITQEILDSKLKLLMPEGPVYKGEVPTIKGPEKVTTVEFDVLRAGRSIWKCHYRISIVENEIRTFACEAPPSDFPAAFQIFSTAAGTFSKLSK